MPFMYCDEKRMDCENSEFLAILLESEDREKIVEYCKKQLLPLRKIEHEQKVEYIRTLKIYFQNNRSIQKTSEVLFVHKNTVTQRLRKVFNLLAISCNDFAKMSELYCMIQILEYYENEV